MWQPLSRKWEEERKRKQKRKGKKQSARTKSPLLSPPAFYVCICVCFVRLRHIFCANVLPFLECAYPSRSSSFSFYSVDLCFSALLFLSDILLLFIHLFVLSVDGHFRPFLYHSFFYPQFSSDFFSFLSFLPPFLSSLVAFYLVFLFFFSIALFFSFAFLLVQNNLIFFVLSKKYNLWMSNFILTSLIRHESLRRKSLGNKWKVNSRV